MYSNEINNLKGIISKTGIIEKLLDYQEKMDYNKRVDRICKKFDD